MYRDPSELRAMPVEEVLEALEKTALYVIRRHRIAGSTAEPALNPEDIAQAAYLDTLSGQRRWRKDVDLLSHFCSVAKSKISNFYTSRESKRADGDVNLYADTVGADASSLTPLPEAELEHDEEGKAFREYLVSSTKEIVVRLFDLYYDKGLMMKGDDLKLAAQCLQLDPTNTAHMQRVYSAKRAMFHHLEQWETRRGTR